jgi:hypothetical protein
MNFDYMGAQFHGNLAAVTIFVGVTLPFFGALLGFFGGFAFAPTTYFVSLCFHLLVANWSQYKNCCPLCFTSIGAYISGVRFLPTQNCI